jgi:hypothetical protein
VPEGKPTVDERLSKLEAACEPVSAAVQAVKRRVWVSGGGAVIAIVVAIYGFGVKAGLARSAEADALELRRQLDKAIETNHRQDIALGSLRERVRVLRRETPDHGDQDP